MLEVKRMPELVVQLEKGSHGTSTMSRYLVLVLLIVGFLVAIRVPREYERGYRVHLVRFTGVKGPGLIDPGPIRAADGFGSICG